MVSVEILEHHFDSSLYTYAKKKPIYTIYISMENLFKTFSIYRNFKCEVVLFTLLNDKPSNYS